LKPSFLSDNRFEDGTPAASAEASGYPAANIADRRPYTVWKAAAAGTFYLSVDAGEAKEADTLALAGHNFGTAQASISVEVSTTGEWAGEQTTALAAFTPLCDYVIMKPFTAETKQFWRIKIVTASVPPYLGVAMIGSRISPARFPKGAFPPERIAIATEENVSKAGHLLGATVRHLPKTVTANLQYPGTAWVEDTYKTFFLNNAGKPIFFGWDLDDWPEKTGLYRIGGDYAPVYDELDRVQSLSVKMQGIFF
jgi:hypothetical protein